MVQSKDDLTSFRISTSEFPERDASEILHEAIGRALMRVQMDPLDGTRLAADITFRASAHFGMTAGMISPMRNVRAPSLIANDDLVLVFMRDGEGVLDQHGSRTEVGQGRAVLTDNGAPASFTFHKQFSPLSLRFSRSILAPHLENLDQFLRAPLFNDGPALRLLESYAGAFISNTSLATPELCQIAIKHMYDLAALAIGAKRDSAEMAANRGLRAARLQSIKTDIVRNLRDHHLSPDTVAARNGISPRYMRMLFEREGASFSEFVLFKRLQLAHHLICDPQNIQRPISSIAFDCGFGDLSHFNHSFRRRYGQTPSEVRASAHIVGR
jgi:AraC-like DNA-binding protein